MFIPIRKRVFFLTMLYQIPAFVKDFSLLSRCQFLCHAEVCNWVHAHGAGVEPLVGYEEDLGVVLLLAVDELPPVDRAGDVEGVAGVDAHAVEVAEVVDPAHVLHPRHVPVEAHPLQKPVPPDPVPVDHHLVFQKFVQDWTEELHRRIFPETSFVVQYLVTHHIGYCCKLFVRAAFLKTQKHFDIVIGFREILRRDVVASPQPHFIGGVDLLGLLVHVLFGGRELTPDPHLVNLPRNQLGALLVVDRDKVVALVEGDDLGEGHPVGDHGGQRVGEGEPREPAGGCGELLAADLLPGPDLDLGPRYLGPERDLPQVVELLLDEVHVGVDRHAVPREVDQVHQEYDPVLEVLPEKVDYQVLGNLLECLDGEDPIVVEDAVQGVEVGVNDPLAHPVEAQVAGGRLHLLPVHDNRHEQPQRVPGLDPLRDLLEGLRGGEGVALVEQDRVGAVGAVGGDRLLGVVHPVGAGAHLEDPRLELLGLALEALQRQVKPPVPEGLPVEGVPQRGQLALAQLVHHHEAELDLLLGEGLQEDLPVAGGREHPVDEAAPGDGLRLDPVQDQLLEISEGSSNVKVGDHLDGHFTLGLCQCFVVLFCQNPVLLLD